VSPSGIEKEFIPCLSVVLRLWVSPSALWLQYVPVARGGLWALGYYWRRRATASAAGRTFSLSRHGTTL